MQWIYAQIYRTRCVCACVLSLGSTEQFLDRNVFIFGPTDTLIDWFVVMIALFVVVVAWFRVAQFEY